jgi:MFS family permease
MSTDVESGTGTSAGATDRVDARVLIVAGVVVLGAIMSILDITVVAVAQRTFQDTFGKTQARVAWTSTGYTLAPATVIPVTGWAADRLGTKRLYMLAIAMFAAGSALCSTAHSLERLALHDMGTSFARVFLVASVLVACCLLPAAFLPRRPTEHRSQESA